MCVLVYLFSIAALALLSLISVRAIDISRQKKKGIMKSVRPWHSSLLLENEDQDLCSISFIADFDKPYTSHTCAALYHFYKHTLHNGLLMTPRFVSMSPDSVS